VNRLAILLMLAVSASACSAATHRDRSVPRAYQRLHPCPATGKPTGRCPGYVRDHIVALCKGGPDTVANMQWQTVAAAKAKDRWECKK